MHADEILDEAQLPIKLAGLCHCFRTEAGAPRPRQRGLYRVHQFTKVEMFAFTLPEQSDAMHRRCSRPRRRSSTALGIPYRVLDICHGRPRRRRPIASSTWKPGCPAAATAAVRRSDQHVQLHRLPGPPAEHPLPARAEGRRASSTRSTARPSRSSRAIIAILENYQRRGRVDPRTGRPAPVPRQGRDRCAGVNAQAVAVTVPTCSAARERHPSSWSSTPSLGEVAGVERGVGRGPLLLGDEHVGDIDGGAGIEPRGLQARGRMVVRHRVRRSAAAAPTASAGTRRSRRA